MIRDYVVQTHPCAEVIAKANLEAKGFRAFLPTVIEEIRTGPRRERRSTVMAPLFPRYMFLALDLADDAWKIVSGVRGVQRILGVDGNRPTPLPEGALSELQARYAAGEFVRRVATYAVSAGDRVTVGQGVFAGHSGVCTVSRGERVKVLLSLLGGAVEVSMTPEMVAVA